MKTEKDLLALFNNLLEPEKAEYFLSYQNKDKYESFLRLIFLNGFLTSLQFVLDEEMEIWQILETAINIVRDLREATHDEIEFETKRERMYSNIMNAVQKPENHPLTKALH